jgi:hypothetical protein
MIDRLIQTGTRKFGPPDRATALTLCAISDTESVKDLERYVPIAKSWDEMFAFVWEEYDVG